MTKFFCPLPWIHQFIQADGIKMCCSSLTKLDLTPIEFANSDYIKVVRETIINGNIPPDCQSCVRLENQGYNSTRTLALNDWDYNIDTVPTQTEYLDLRHSNLCNFSCRTCDPAFSSEISRELSEHDELKTYHGIASNIHMENTLIRSDLINFLPTVKRINFTGGEPLLIKENISVFEELIASGNIDCEILITTNGSVINNKILELIKKFNNVHWTISIDGVGTTAEYIRNGTKWEKLQDNINQILLLGHSVAFNTVLSAYSVLNLSNLAKFFKAQKEKFPNQPFEIWYAICDTPDFLHPQVLTKKLKDKSLVEITQTLMILTDIEKTVHISSLGPLNSLQKNLNDSIINETLSNKFIEYTLTMDKIRNQNFNQTFNIDLLS
jgi:sulfatase maturation enzyme AslB (radical SAM superfamily)